MTANPQPQTNKAPARPRLTVHQHAAIQLTLAAAVVVVDSLAKALLKTTPSAYDIRPGWLLLPAIAGIFLTGLAFLSARSPLITIAAGLMLGGITGNVLWRVFNKRGVPNPFLVGLRHGYLAFNVADICVMLGAVVLFVGVANYVLADQADDTGLETEKG